LPQNIILPADIDKLTNLIINTMGRSQETSNKKEIRNKKEKKAKRKG